MSCDSITNSMFGGACPFSNTSNLGNVTENNEKRMNKEGWSGVESPEERGLIRGERKKVFAIKSCHNFFHPAKGSY